MTTSFINTTCMAIFVTICALLLSSYAAIAAPQNTSSQQDRQNAPSGYAMAGMNGGRGGLPGVNLWVEQSQLTMFRKGATSWNYPEKSQPADMNYSGWNFWQFGVSDALLQLIFEASTDPSDMPPKLGPYFLKLRDSGITCWSKAKTPPAGLVIDLSKQVPLTESFRSDHYITYGITYHLYYSGSARFLLSVDGSRHMSVSLISSTFPDQATASLKTALEDLSGHPLLSFPKSGARVKSVKLIADFVIERQPGAIEPARH